MFQLEAGMQGCIRQFRRDRTLPAEARIAWEEARDAMSLLSLYAFAKDKRGSVRASFACVGQLVKAPPAREPRIGTLAACIDRWLADACSEDEVRVAMEDVLRLWGELEKRYDGNTYANYFGITDIYASRALFLVGAAITGIELKDPLTGSGYQPPAAITNPAARAVAAAACGLADPESANVEISADPDKEDEVLERYEGRYFEVQSRFAGIVRAHVPFPASLGS